MSLALRLRPLARADLDDIWTYTTETWGADQAEQYLRGLGATFDLLAEYPDLARVRFDLTPPMRLYPHRAHLVVYQIGEGTLDVVRILHSRSNWAAILSD